MMIDEETEDDRALAALARYREAWVGCSVALVLSMQRAAWTPEDMLAAVARYRDLEPLIVALNGAGGLHAIRPTLPLVARVLGIEGDLSGAGRKATLMDAWDKQHAGLKRLTPGLYTERRKAYEESIGAGR